LPYLIRSVLQVRGIVEELSATEVIEDAPLARAYGTAIFKCPVVQCPYFDYGFSTRRVRDEHSKGHSREYKCTVSSCDYSSIGFSTNSALRRHSAICHESLPNIPTFPKAKRLSTARALKDAIDQGNDLAVRALATEISTAGSWETGFILQAVKRESWSVASILIEVLGTEAELNHRAADGKAALHFVAAKGNEGLLRKILEKCANLDLMDSRSRSALLYAILGLHFECAKLLLRSSFTRIIPYQTDVAQAFLAAAADGQIEILQFLIRKANRMTGSEQFKALEVAAENGRGKVVRFLLEEGRRLRTQYPSSSVLGQKQPEPLSIDEMEALLMVSTTAGKAQAEILQKVVEHEETERVAQILEQKYCRSADAWHVALKTAAGKGSIRIVELLLSVEAKLLTARRNPIVAVKPAAACGRPDIIELLLSPEANMDAPASLHISTFLLRTAINGQRYLALILAETEASSDRGGQFANATILQLAADGFSSMLLHELAIKGDIFIQDKDALVNAAMTGHEGMVQVLTMAGPQLLDIDSFREAGRLIAAGNLSIYCALSEAIVAAIEYGNSEVIRILLDSGAGAKWVQSSVSAPCDSFRRSYRLGGRSPAFKLMLPKDKWQPTYQPLTTLEDSQMQLRLLGQQNKNSALQDCHFLLILLEQQNKKRLLMARLERDARNMP
jgi:ankyrin repeat protein